MTGIAIHLTLRALDAALARGVYLLECARFGAWACRLWVQP